ncbi:hypothetical protein [Lutimonas vermicola]|uniref:DUF3990 domain-containing protein n=1 Tax=Lutimonas vermicola TaxID=414288 RepID=A0ABU9L4W6_9FLAO
MIKRKDLYDCWYHGTDRKAAKLIYKGNINVNLGVGELGQGFYMGNFLHEAKAWAFHKNGKNNIQNSVIQFTIKPFLSLKYRYIGTKRARALYKKNKINNGHRTFKFNKDLIHSKVFMVERYDFQQLKWESLKGEKTVNTISKALLK